MKNYQKLLETQQRKLEKALQHLQYSYNKVINLPNEIKNLDEESLETWESFAARFSRASEIFLTQHLRTIVLMNDPGFTGSLRDFINQGEKLGIIDDAKAWIAIRELRNITAHNYSEKDLSNFFKLLKKECPRLLKILPNKDWNYVRLSKLEIEQIIKAVTPFLRGQRAEIRSYGSRTNDDLKGGDIDLLLILDKSESVTMLLAKKHEILAQIKGLIGEQKIDLKIAYKQELKNDPFLKLIMPKSILLHRW